MVLRFAQAAKPEQAHPEAQSLANAGLFFWPFANNQDRYFKFFQVSQVQQMRNLNFILFLQALTIYFHDMKIVFHDMKIIFNAVKNVITMQYRLLLSFSATLERTSCLETQSAANVGLLLFFYSLLLILC
ncbi:MAG: hypothetical protein IJS63_06290 [Bacteroidaceae bacterium]|nr:hypothetical protein [Bacteroidaceae bacterium]